MIIRTLRINPDIIWIALLGVVTLLASVYLARQAPFMFVLVPSALIVVSLFLANDEVCLATAVLFLPFFSSGPFSLFLLPMPGAKINHIMLVLMLIGFLLNRKLQIKDVKIAAFFYSGSILLLVTAAFRTEHVASYSIANWGELYQPFRFFLRHGFIQLLTSITFLMIIGGVRAKRDVIRVIFYMALSMILFAVTISGIYFLSVPLGSDFSITREIIGGHLGMHGNNLADFIIVGFPLTLSMALMPKGRYQKWFYLAAILTIVAATLIYSRSAYATILFSIPAIILLTRRYRLLIPLLVILVLVVALVPGVTERATTGFEEGDPSIITAGRIDRIWGPVFGEWRQWSASDPMKFLFGNGRYGILDLHVFKSQQMYLTSHAHNMFLDTLLDVGLVGLLFYVVIIATVIVQLSQALYRRRKLGSVEEIHLLAGLLVAIASFMIRGLTDSFLLPHITNSYFYIVMAVSFVVLLQERTTLRIEEGK